MLSFGVAVTFIEKVEPRHRNFTMTQEKFLEVRMRNFFVCIIMRNKMLFFLNQIKVRTVCKKSFWEPFKLISTYLSELFYEVFILSKFDIFISIF